MRDGNLTDRLGMMPLSKVIDSLQRLFHSRRLRIAIGLALLAAVACGGHFFFWRYHLKRFTEVAPGVLYRVAQPTEFGLRHLADAYGIRTVVSLQLFDFRLYRGLIDFGKQDGDRESEYVTKIGLRHVQWPMGDEMCWPWPDPWELQEFLRLVDDPNARPILIHCQGGRHRTGTMTAIYRLEYERRPIAEVLREMYSYSFGKPIPAQERNLRTYVPRPLPTPEEWPAVAAMFEIDRSRSAPETIPTLALKIRSDRESGRLRNTLADALVAEKPYALALASRVIDTLDDSLIAVALPPARKILEQRRGTPRDVTAATAMIADFGTGEDQRRLLELLQSRGGREKAFYEAVACGIFNRYTPNRLAFLKPLLMDRTPRPGDEFAGLSYADTAVVRTVAITDGLPIALWSDESLANDGPQLVLNWLSAHPESTAIGRLAPPPGRRVALEGDGPQEEDLSRVRR